MKNLDNLMEAINNPEEYEKQTLYELLEGDSLEQRKINEEFDKIRGLINNGLT